MAGRIAALLAWMVWAGALAGEVHIEHVRLVRQADGAYEAQVRLRHADTGWEHYSDAWRVVAADGAVLGTRVLYHPHVDEQPFTRSLGDIRVPSGVGAVYVEAHDKVHGWSPDRVQVDLAAPRGERFEVVR